MLPTILGKMSMYIYFYYYFHFATIFFVNNSYRCSKFLKKKNFFLNLTKKKFDKLINTCRKFSFTFYI